jgi:hypothetical protein
MSTSSNSTEEFLALVRASTIDVAQISRLLDGLSHEDRVSAIRSTRAGDQPRLYAASDGFAPVRLTELVSPRVSDLATVRHYGKNSLAVFTEFEKRFSRPPMQDPEAPKELIGFNFQTMAPVTGPGYFTAVDDEERGEVLIDYRRIPDERPVDWPELRGNTGVISRFVYGFMVDTLRRVSQHVTIGSAARKGKDTGNWFMLCREV